MEMYEGLPVIGTMGPKDVLFGRGNGIAMKEGNVNFRGVVAKFRESYATRPRREKSGVTEEVYNIITRMGGRFLEKLPCGKYVEVPRKKALDKTCQALREKFQPAQAKSSSEETPTKPNPFPSPRRSKAKTKVKICGKRKRTSAPARKASAAAPSPATTVTRSMNATKKSKSVPIKQESRSQMLGKPNVTLPSVKPLQPTAPNQSTSQGRTKCPDKTPRFPPRVSVTPTPPVLTKGCDRNEHPKQKTVHPGRMYSGHCASRDLVKPAIPKQDSRLLQPLPLSRAATSDIDEMFAVLPPHLTAFFSGIYSNTFGSNADCDSFAQRVDEDPYEPQLIRRTTTKLFETPIKTAGNSKTIWGSTTVKDTLLSGSDQSSGNFPPSPPTVMDFDFMDMENNQGLELLGDDLDDDFFVEDFRQLMG